ncbi:HesA/MoeB/ThiF family protein [Candidatus Woesearchaeota archaeon]|nr:HesA/MoeB/ThiF family protein [Candidatus Woesearchaeota archaeon]
MNYSRQALVIGEERQRKLEKKKVAIVGVGALGTVAAELLVRSGIGSLLLIDRDVVEESNLQRQILFTEKDVERSKAAVAKEKLMGVNAEIKIDAQPVHLSSANIRVLKNYDLVLDCTDNLQTRLLLNDFCRKEKILWIYAAAIKESGMVMPIFPGRACLRCFMREASLDTCETVGVLNTITAMIAAFQVNLAVKILLGEKVESILHHFDLNANEFKKLKVKQNPACPTCRGRYEYLAKKDVVREVRFCSSERYQITGKPKDLQGLKEKWKKIDVVEDDGYTLRFRNITLFQDGRALIKAKSEQEALAAYSKWVGN